MRFTNPAHSGTYGLTVNRAISPSGLSWIINKIALAIVEFISNLTTAIEHHQIKSTQQFGSI